MEEIGLAEQVESSVGNASVFGKQNFWERLSQGDSAGLGMWAAFEVNQHLG